MDGALLRCAIDVRCEELPLMTSLESLTWKSREKSEEQRVETLGAWLTPIYLPQLPIGQALLFAITFSAVE